MCVSPITMRNSSSYIRLGSQRLYNTFSCGKCYECREAKMTAMQLRCVNELISCNANNGVSLYITLTFNNQNLPVIDLSNYVINDYQQDPEMGVHNNFTYEKSKKSNHTTWDVRSLVTRIYRNVQLSQPLVTYVEKYNDKGMAVGIEKKVSRYFDEILKEPLYGSACDKLTPSSLSMPNGSGIPETCLPCFSTSVIQNYKKRVQSRFKALGLSNCVRSLICSEYGSTYGRPHHHCTFHIYGLFTDNDTADQKAEKIRQAERILQDCWSTYDPVTHTHTPIGITSFGSLGSVITDERAMKYVSKYIVKDWNFQKKCDSFFQILKKEAKNCGYDLPNMFLSRINDIKPKHYQSINYGFFNDGEFLREDIETLESKEMLNTDSTGSLVRIPMPQYYLRKLFYEFNSDGKYSLTDYGRSVFMRSLGYEVSRDALKFKTTLQKYSEKDMQFTPSMLRALQVDSPQSALVKIHNVLHSLSDSQIYDYSLYMRCYRYYINIDECLNDAIQRDPLTYLDNDMEPLYIRTLHKYATQHINLLRNDLMFRDMPIPSLMWYNDPDNKYQKLPPTYLSPYYENIATIFGVLKKAIALSRNDKLRVKNDAYQACKDSAACLGHTI